MAKDFSLTKYFKEQYLKEALSRSNSRYVTPTTGIKKSTAEYVTDEEKSNAEKETNAMRSSKFTAYDEDGEQPYLREFQQPKSFDPDTIRLVREMLEAADIYHNDLVGGDGEVSSFLDKRSGGTYFKFPHFNGGPGMFGKSTVDRIDFSKAEAKEAALKTYTQFKEYIEDYEISDASPTGVYGSVYLFVMFNDSAEDYTAPKGGTQSSQFENMNDPVLMRARAAREKQPESSRGGLDFEDVMYLRDEQKDLEDRIAQLYRDMEQEAEPEGGEIADRYGSMLNKLEDKLYRVKKQINQYDMNESIVTESKGAKLYFDDLKYYYTKTLPYLDKDEVEEYKQLAKNYFSKLQEGSCGYTPDGKPRSKPASSDLIELKEKIFNSLKK